MSLVEMSSETTASYETLMRPRDRSFRAPPPYECFVPPPDQRRNDWNCVLENEVNGSRRLAPIT
uniref:Uncharacterized protein n=1 Tax=Heterorhabditis bacteriophora TaxID=37862 RepID=A0A1I7XS15_HETBA